LSLSLKLLVGSFDTFVEVSCGEDDSQKDYLCAESSSEARHDAMLIEVSLEGEVGGQRDADQEEAHERHDACLGLQS